MAGNACQLGTYLENYLESVSGLPGELKRNFSLIEELDARTKESLEEIENISRKSYVDSDRREKTKLKIRKRYTTCIEFADEKISLAAQTYEMVDKHIRRLDIDLRKFEVELERNKNAHHGESKNERPVLRRSKNSTISKQKKGKGRTRVGFKKQQQMAQPISTPSLNVEIDMPVDPNEPTYCFCKRVSFGEMVGCDNSDCRVEWFHFGCVGLTATPKGKWLCPECRSLKAKAEKRI